MSFLLTNRLIPRLLPIVPALFFLLLGCNLVAMTPTPVRVAYPTLPPFADTPTPEPIPITAPTLPPSNGRVLLLGDSITKGWNISALYPNTVNAGEVSDTSGRVLARYQAYYAGQPFETAVLQVGINDLTSGVTDDTLQNNVIVLTTMLRQTSGRVVVGSLLPVDATFPPTIHQRILTVNQWLHDYAGQQGFGYIDFYSAMSDPTGLANRAYFTDGLHPSPSGYARMTELLAEALR